MIKQLKILLATSLLSIALGAQAALPTEVPPRQVMVPYLPEAFNVWFAGWYAEPTNSDLVYARLVKTPALPQPTTSRAYVLNPDTNFGFRVGMAYTFAESGNNVQLAWTHFNHKSAAQTTPFAPTEDDNLIPPDGISFGTTLEGFRVFARREAKFAYDAVDLEVGQFLAAGPRLQTRLFAGLRYAQIENDLLDVYTFDAIFANLVALSNYQYFSKLYGIGPRLGIDAVYHLGAGFGLLMSVSGQLLVSELKESCRNRRLDFETDLMVVQAVFDNSFQVDNQVRVVPGGDIRLGIDYTYLFSNDVSSVTFELGYHATHYIDAVGRVYSGTAANSASWTTSGVGFHGPYLSANVTI